VIFAHLYIASIFSSITTRLGGYRHAQRGQGMVEYALVIAVVAIVAIIGLAFLGKQLGSTFSNITESLNLPNPGQ
jgi:pilus assembly protein Flp/PilA